MAHLSNNSSGTDPVNKQVGKRVLVLKVLNKRRNEEWRRGVIHNYREFSEYDTMTVHFGGQSYIKLVTEDKDHLAYSYPDSTAWSKQGKATQYRVKADTGVKDLESLDSEPPKTHTKSANNRGRSNLQER